MSNGNALGAALANTRAQLNRNQAEKDLIRLSEFEGKDIIKVDREEGIENGSREKNRVLSLGIEIKYYQTRFAKVNRIN